MDLYRLRRLRAVRDQLAAAPSRAKKIADGCAQKSGRKDACADYEIGALRASTQVAVIDLDDLLAELEREGAHA